MFRSLRAQNTADESQQASIIGMVDMREGTEDPCEAPRRGVHWRGAAFFLIDRSIGYRRHATASETWGLREVDFGFIDVIEGARVDGLGVDRDDFRDGLVIETSAAECFEILI